MAKQSQAWKDLERHVAKALTDAGVPAERVLRGGDYSESAPDIVVPSMPWLKLDCKYRTAPTTMASRAKMLGEVKAKYCDDTDTPVLITRHRGRQDVVVTLYVNPWFVAIGGQYCFELALADWVELVRLAA